MGAMRLKSPASRMFTQPFIPTQMKENIKAPRHWPLYGEFTGDRWIPRTNGQLRGKCLHLMTSSCTDSISEMFNLPVAMSLVSNETNHQILKFCDFDIAARRG